MQQPFLLFEYHPLFVVVCLIVATGYTWLLYRKSNQWNKAQLYALMSVRFLVVFLLSVLLLGPIFKHIQNQYEKPIAVIFVDNSKSIGAVLDSLEIINVRSTVNNIQSQFINANYETELRSLNDKNLKSSDLRFDQDETNLHKILQSIENDYENRNLVEVILISDGIFNSGISPNFKRYNFRLSTLGLGDTIPKRDILIKELKYNKLSYQGNQFPLLAEIENRGYKDEMVAVSVFNNGKLLEKKSLSFNHESSIQSIEFLINAQSKGLQRYTVSVAQKINEFNSDNNTMNAFVEIIDGKERILMIAASPHPDVKAIRSAIESNSNYEFELFIPGIDKAPEGKYDLVIYHQFPDRRNLILPWYEKFISQDVPSWIITTVKSNYTKLNESISYASMERLSDEVDNVTASINEGFSSFTISEELKELLSNVPPLQVPFSRVNTNAPVLLFQRIGDVTTTNPLLLVSEIDNNKNALLLSDGIWRWRLFEYAKYERHSAFNELILKMVQYLSTRQDKRKFKFSVVSKEISTSEKARFESQVYNDLYEPIYNKSIDIKLTNEDGKLMNYDYITSVNNSRFEVSDLAPGVYKYSAATTVDGEKQTVSGEFFVKNNSIELTNLTANFSLLEDLASKSNGRFQTVDVNMAVENLVVKESPEIIHSEESFMPIINKPLVFVLLILLISTEWFIRKYSGHY